MKISHFSSFLGSALSILCCCYFFVVVSCYRNRRGRGLFKPLQLVCALAFTSPIFRIADQCAYTQNIILMISMKWESKSIFKLLCDKYFNIPTKYLVFLLLGLAYGSGTFWIFIPISIILSLFHCLYPPYSHSFCACVQYHKNRIFHL